MKSLHLLTFCFLMLFQQAAHSRECFSYLLGGNPQLFSMLQNRLRHYSQTIIYNATTNQIVEGSTRENF